MLLLKLTARFRSQHNSLNTELDFQYSQHFALFAMEHTKTHQNGFVYYHLKQYVVLFIGADLELALISVPQAHLQAAVL